LEFGEQAQHHRKYYHCQKRPDCNSTRATLGHSKSCYFNGPWADKIRNVLNKVRVGWTANYPRACATISTNSSPAGL
jgi:hypothetical protein